MCQVAQDDTIQELRKSLSRSDALSRTGAGTSLHFLTREMADEEKQNVQREVNRLKKMVKEKDNVIDEKEVHIKALDESSMIFYSFPLVVFSSFLLSFG